MDQEQEGGADITREIATEIGMAVIQCVRLSAELRNTRALLKDTEGRLAMAEAENVRLEAGSGK